MNLEMRLVRSNDGRRREGYVWCQNRTRSVLRGVHGAATTDVNGTALPQQPLTTDHKTGRRGMRAICRGQDTAVGIRAIAGRKDKTSRQVIRVVPYIINTAWSGLTLWIARSRCSVIFSVARLVPTRRYGARASSFTAAAVAAAAGQPSTVDRLRQWRSLLCVFCSWCTAIVLFFFCPPTSSSRHRNHPVPPITRIRHVRTRATTVITLLHRLVAFVYNYWPPRATSARVRPILRSLTRFFVVSRLCAKGTATVFRLSLLMLPEHLNDVKNG